jgi:murein DD-endopeptidase MepM/ murein hydrolase activator NlpD
MAQARRRPDLIARQSTRKRGGRIWPLLVVTLLGVNIYLFGFRGLPALERDGAAGDQRAARPAAAATEAGPPQSIFRSRLGEMSGVAGVRTQVAAPVILPALADDVGGRFAAGGPAMVRAALGSLRLPVQRFDLEGARAVAGQRTIAQWCRKVAGRIQPGDSFASALVRSGVSDAEAYDLIQALKPVFDFRTCRPGERFELLQAPDGRVHQLAYRKSPEVTYRIQRRGQQLDGRRQVHPVETDRVQIAVRVEGSLWNALEKWPQRAKLVSMIVDIFAWDIDFYVDTHPGDSIRLIVERHRVRGRFARYGRILAAEYAGDVGVHRAFWYDAGDGDPDSDATRGYFDDKGDSLRKAFLKSPLKFARVSSSYGMRVHPVLGFNRMHNGIDFAAPVGTPVWAPADGTVLVAGYRGASGRMIKLRHANGYATVFCHLSSIARGVRPGQRVRQKQVIGRVGSTGRSTGPHLHYGMKLRGRYVNPLAQKFPPADPVPASELDTYRAAIAELVEQLDAVALPPARTAARDGSQDAEGARKEAG